MIRPSDEVLRGLRVNLLGLEKPSRRVDALIACAFKFPDLRPAEPDDFDGKYGYTEGSLKVETGFLTSGLYQSDLNEALRLLKETVPGLNWLLGAGRSSGPDEPFYGCVLYDGVDAVAGGEHDMSPGAAVILALIAYLLGERMPEGDIADRAQELVIEERARQLAEEGWTPEHDDEHVGGEMALAAAEYAAGSAGRASKTWPWMHHWWKPASPLRMLVKAGALILAEIERRLRAGERP